MPGQQKPGSRKGTKKLYVIQLNIETMAYAENEEEAKKLGLRGIEEDFSCVHEEDLFAYVYKHGEHGIPYGWEMDSIPWGSPDKTLKELTDAG